MKARITFALFLSLATIAQARLKYGTLVMTSPNSAKVVYEEKCANGGNNDKEKQLAFLNAMLANPKSDLAQLKEKLLKEIGDDKRGDGFYLSEPVASFHDRDGCGASRNTYSVMIYTLTGGNTNHTVARFLVNVDDDDESGIRTLKLRSIQPLAIRDDN